MKIEYENPPEPGKIMQVCGGIEWACLPLPFALDHVNCWLLGEPDQQVLFDTGVDNAATRALWETIFSQRKHWPERLLVSHFHPDHTGLAGWFKQNGCEHFIGSQIETRLGAELWHTNDLDYSSVYEQWYAANGLPEEVVAAAKKNGNTYRGRVHTLPHDGDWTFIEAGQTLTLAGRNYTVIKGQGHAPDMIMLYRNDDHVLIAADQVLPFISPNVSVMPRLTDNNPLQSFLSCLASLHELPADTFVLPSHGLPFRGLHARLDALHKHHEMRLEQVLEACREPLSAHDLFAVLFKRKLDAQQMSFALGESLAHLRYLEQQGQVQRLDDTAVTRFVVL